jgi:type II secretory pathway component PulM
MKQLVIDRWQGFSQKEQVFLGVFGSMTLIFFLYAYAWLPTQQASEKFAKELPKKAAQLNLMKLQAAEIESKRSQFHLTRTSKEGLKASVERSAKAQGILLDQLTDQPDPVGHMLHVQISTLSFDTWVKWIEGLQANQGIRVISCVISPNVKAGEVKVDAVLGAQN